MTDRIEVLYDESTIAKCNEKLAGEIAKRKPERLLVIAILKGSFVFAADLLRSMHRAGLEPEVDFITLSSYGAGTKSSGEVKVLRDIQTDVAGRDVLLVDDILESGRTLNHARALMVERGAKSTQIAVLLDKPGKRAAKIEADYVGFTCADLFVVGYGMDKAHAYRQLPFVGYLVNEEK
ncbi:MAG: hypoxanthine phosphoribosyltransferase [Cohaesibacteraceae bacterium]|nr:hypoxanthine phosphoribosyltransferase [Cohaesibacteraceae bacterium]